RPEQRRHGQIRERVDEVALLDAAQEHEASDRDHHRAAEALEDARGDQGVERVRRAAADRAEGENDDGGAEDRARPEPVGDPAGRGYEHRQRQHVGRQSELEDDRVLMEVVRDRRQRSRDHRAVHVLHEQGGGDDEGGEQGWAHGKPRPFGAASGSSQGGDGVVWSQWFEGALGGGGFRPPRARRAPRHHHSDTTSLRRRTNVATVKFPGRCGGVPEFPAAARSRNDQFEGNSDMNIKSLALALALAQAVVGVAHASSTTIFELTGPDGETSFDLPTMPSVDGYQSGYDFATDDYNYYFYNASNGGGWNNYFGAQLYTGPESSPTFVTGTYSMYNGDTGNTDSVTLSAAPEPATWALMGLSFAGLAFAGFRRANGALVAA